MQLVQGMRKVPLRDRVAFNSMFVLEHLLPRSRSVKARRRRAHERVVEAVRRGGPGRRIEVERRRDLSPREFRRDYLRKGIPVVLEGAASEWPLMERWTFEEFRRNYGGETIKLVQREGLTDEEVVTDREYSEEIGFGEFLDLVLAGDAKYMRFSPLLERFPELLRHFDHAYFERLARSRIGMTFQMFIGGGGTLTPFHNAVSPFLFTTVAGTKRWLLVPTHYQAVMNPSVDGFEYGHSGVAVDLSNADEYPGLESIDHLEAITEPGDLLFVPSWMWHAVVNDDATIGVRCGFMYLPGLVRESFSLTFIRVFAGDLGLLRWFYYSFIDTNLPDRQQNLVTPKWFRFRRELDDGPVVGPSDSAGSVR